MFLPVPLPAEMAAWDQKSIEFGLSGAVLMENASRQAFELLLRKFGGLTGKRILVLAGGGNNGGDAFCLARLALDAGACPLLVCLRQPEAYLGDSAHNLALAKEIGVPLINLEQAKQLAPEIIVDGMLGTGFNADLRQPELGLIQHINSQSGRAFILALDLPSGLNAATGQACPIAVQADLTVCFQAPKPGLLTTNAAQYVGELVVAPIGIPKLIQAQLPPACRVWQGNSNFTDMRPYDLRDLLLPPERACPDPHLPAHKGEAGKVLIFGGSRWLSGAPRLAGQAAFRAGAGLVCLGGPQSLLPVLSAEPEFTLLSLGACPQGLEWPDQLPPGLADEISKFQAIVAGPGMSRNNGAGEFLRLLLELPQRPALVLDADALRALTGQPDLLQLLRRDDILTPHPGEAASILGLATAEVQADRFAALAGLAARAEAIWILKGESSLVHVPGQPVTICPFRAPNLAVAGSGDVLAGLISALLAGGLSAEGAAIAGVHAHGLAGLLLAGDYPQRGNLPQDIADYLPQALNRLDLSEFRPVPNAESICAN